MNSALHPDTVAVAVLAAVAKPLHYSVPDRFGPLVKVGSLVLVPLRTGTAVAVVLQGLRQETSPLGSLPLKPILNVADHLEPVPEDLVRLGEWIASYYFYPLGEVFKNLLPPPFAQPPQSRLTLSPAGREQVRDSSELLQLLFDQGPQSLTALKSRIQPWRRLRALIADHDAHGWLETLYEWPGGDGTRPGVPWVCLAADAGAAVTADAGLGRAGIEVIERLREAGGRLPLRELRRHCRHVDYWVRKLVRAGRLEVTRVLRPRPRRWAQDIQGSPPPELTPDQRRITEAVAAVIAAPRFFPTLVHGITGSGKTEIYLHLAAQALACKRSVLILVPEIALSTQLEALFRQRFGDALGVWHSAVPPEERARLWRQLAGGEIRLVLGVRSAVFSPLRDLGLIVVDEEHDASYKQEDRLRYHARDAALMRAKRLAIPIVLGSATPSLQSLQHCREGRYQLHNLTSRIEDQPLPELEIIDMRREHGPFRVLSRPLQQALIDTRNDGRQALLFLNRRGFAGALVCRRCGQSLHCGRCSVSLTLHHQDNLLLCHYCGYSMAPPTLCPSCGAPTLVPLGFGTERLEEEAGRLLPSARIVRIDRDSVTNPRQLLQYLNSVRSGAVDLVIGTQMIAKGHDFPHLTLVGVVNADIGLQVADFRASEATVQLLIQVAGRAGRREQRGRVLIQTYNPDHYTMEAVRRLDYNLFAEHELASRRSLQYPPFSRFAKLLVTGADETRARAAAEQLSAACTELVAAYERQNRYLAVLGPAPAPLAKLKDRFRWQLYVKAWRNRDLQDFVSEVLTASRRLPALRRIELAVDRDPVSHY